MSAALMELMKSEVEKYAESYAEKYAEGKRIDALYETLMNLMETMKWTAEQAMEAMKISETDKKLLIPRL